MLQFTNMVDLARTPEDIKEEKAEATSPVMAGKLPRYGYGTCLCLGQDELEKLGLAGDLPAVGEEVQFCARAKVTSASANEREGEDGKVETVRRVELQITHMGVPAPDAAGQQMEKSAARQKSWYGDGQADGESGGD